MQQHCILYLRSNKQPYPLWKGVQFNVGYFMSISTPQQIGAAGEQIVGDWLKANGYPKVVVNTKLPGSTDIEADGATRKLLVQVKTAQKPSWPTDPSGEEIRNIKSRASNTGREAWIAKATLDANLNLVGKIDWLQP
jgi:hypothetical protein